MKKLRSFLSKFRTSSGFTLIELLVVIGILGVLASALVATIDPFEQLNKAQDSNLKNTSVEFLNANIRYYTTHNAMPWDTAANGGDANCNAAIPSTNPTAVPLNTISSNCITALINEGELKQGFTTFSGLSKIFVTEPNPQTTRQNDIITCFKPSSKSQQKDAATRYAQDGSTGVNCKSTGGNVDCYWCAQ